MVKILKIGGSILTDKSEAACARHDEIKRIAVEIADAMTKPWISKSDSIEHVDADKGCFAEDDGCRHFRSKPCDLILVHGAGSFGHVPARQYGLPGRFSPAGLHKTHEMVVELNRLVVDSLFQAGLRPLPMHPLGCTLLKNGRIEMMEVSIIKEMMHRGILPVLHGDVAMDSENASGIVSGDQIVSYLASKLKAKLVALGTDVDGVLHAGKVVPRITRKDFLSMREQIGQSRGIDVTGGMAGKVGELLELADMGVSSTIFNASVAGNVEIALQGGRIGTAIVPDEPATMETAAKGGRSR
jgi:isopentenyl phosphate kinase